MLFLDAAFTLGTSLIRISSPAKVLLKPSSSLSTKTLSSAPNGYDPNHLGVRFRLRGEQMEISLLELGRRIGLYSKRQSRESATLSVLRKGVTPTAREAMEEDKEDDEGDEVAGGGAGHEGARGSANMYRNMSQGDWQVHQERWMDQQDEQRVRINTWMGQQDERAHWMYDHTIRQFQYMSTRDNLDPHL
ncbi:hypothetical protein Tco_0247362 [Tanacetum coccineum]